MIVQPLTVYRDPLPVDSLVELQLAGSGGEFQRAEVGAGGLAGFETDPHDNYLVRIRASGYGAVGKIVDGREERVDILVPIRSSRVGSYQWPEPLPEIPGVATDPDRAQTGGVLWALLANRKRAALLNIWAKLWRVQIGAMGAAATFVERVIRVEQDRVFAEVHRALPELLGECRDLDPVTSALHEPPRGYEPDVSVKTRDRYGNLQISTFVNDAGDVVADIDIDENRRALAHLFDVIEHHALDRRTDPIEIHEILVGYQDIDPGWRPVLA